MKSLKNKKGFTLMELVVGILMFTIISITISMLLAPILSSYARANDFAEYNALLDNIANQIIDDMSQSTLPPVFLAGEEWSENNPDRNNPEPFLTVHTHSRTIRYAVINNVLEREGLVEVRDALGNITSVEQHWFPVFAEDFYKRKLVSFRIVPDNTTSATAYILTVRLTEDRGAAPFQIERDYAVRPLVLNPFN